MQYPWLKIVMVVSMVGVVAYVSLGLIAYFLTDVFLFPVPVVGYADTPEIIKLTTATGARLSAKYLANPQAHYTILYSHGNGEDLAYSQPLIEHLYNLGFSVFIYDYEGYGTSSGKPGVKKLASNIDAAYDYLTRTLHLPPAQILVWGRSLGGGPSVDLARRRPVGGLVLESTYVSVFRVVFPLKILPFDRLASIDLIDQVKVPVLVIHGTKDATIPFGTVNYCFDKTRASKAHIWVENAGHNSILQTNSAQYDQGIRDF